MQLAQGHVIQISSLLMEPASCFRSLFPLWLHSTSSVRDAHLFLYVLSRPLSQHLFVHLHLVWLKHWLYLKKHTMRPFCMSVQYAKWLSWVSLSFSHHSLQLMRHASQEGILLLGASALPQSEEEEKQSPISLAGTLECPLLIPNPPGAPRSLPKTLHHQPVGTQSPLPASRPPSLSSNQDFSLLACPRRSRVKPPSRAFQSMCYIRPVERSARQIYRVTHHCNRPCNGSVALTQSLSNQYLLTRFIDVLPVPCYETLPIIKGLFRDFIKNNEKMFHYCSGIFMILFLWVLNFFPFSLFLSLG